MSTYQSVDGHTGGRKHTCRQCSISKTQSCMFYNSDGSLTRYALSCGYVECQKPPHKHNGSSRRTTLERTHNTYHVKGYDAQEKYVWESFPTLTLARKFFRTMKRAIRYNDCYDREVR
jgi:hypothetical protein